MTSSRRLPEIRPPMHPRPWRVVGPIQRDVYRVGKRRAVLVCADVLDALDVYVVQTLNMADAEALVAAVNAAQGKDKRQQRQRQRQRCFQNPTENDNNTPPTDTK